MKPIFSSSSSTKLPGEAPSTSTIWSQHAARATSGSIEQTYNQAVAAGVLIVTDSCVRCVKIAVVPRVVGPTDSVYAPIVGNTFVYLLDCVVI